MINRFNNLVQKVLRLWLYFLNDIFHDNDLGTGLLHQDDYRINYIENGVVNQVLIGLPVFEKIVGAFLKIC